MCSITIGKFAECAIITRCSPAKAAGPAGPAEPAELAEAHVKVYIWSGVTSGPVVFSSALPCQQPGRAGPEHPRADRNSDSTVNLVTGYAPKGAVVMIGIRSFID
jgi:hypothetical protein